ncbi:hypothetical protein GALMADRAFT_208615 [Galerina marginata CBS 339.88]|uniref:Uncharacterized protein n=1 Tax=Galerina marginata (strain CBS 339.88) TaxID=685588 RepID=A0A067TGV7_GALM3|nr:hypothetical protein GALMADRAFT_208615 [Galerina marginata CBS 339.88]
MRFFFLYAIFPFVPYWILLCLAYFGHSETHDTSIAYDITVARFDFLSPHTYGFILPVVAPSVGLAAVVISTTAITYHPAPEPKIFMLMLLECWVFGNLIVFAAAERPLLEVLSYPPWALILLQLAAFCLLYLVFYRLLVNAGLNREQMGFLGFLPFYLARCLVAGVEATFLTISFPFTCLGSTLIDIGTIVISLGPAFISLGPAVISLGTAVVNFGTKMVEFYNSMSELLSVFCNEVPTSPTLPPPCPRTSAQVPPASSRSDINICPPPPYSSNHLLVVREPQNESRYTARSVFVKGFAAPDRATTWAMVAMNRYDGFFRDEITLERPCLNYWVMLISRQEKQIIAERRGEGFLFQDCMEHVLPPGKVWKEIVLGLA